MRKYSGFAAAVILAVFVTIFAGCREKTGHTPEEPKEIPTLFGIAYENYEIIEGEIGANEPLGKVFGRFGVGPATVYRVEQACKDTFDLRKVLAGNKYTAFMGCDSTGSRLAHFVYEKSLTDYMVISFEGDSIAVKHRSKPVRIERRRAKATIESSLWNAIAGQNLPLALASEMEDIYGWSVDFFGIQPGDEFEVIYDQRYVDTMQVGIGRIWGSVFLHGGKQLYAIPFKQDGKVSYWDENGNSLRKQFLKAPLKFTRISSKFSNSRLHPVYRVYRPHHGVDYAAPSGTHVHAVADGVVTSRGWAGGGGNTIWIKHARNYTTGYLHLKSFAKGIAVGTRVKQGQLIGYVGSTGTSTGPHLDFRVKVGGKAIDPLRIPSEPGEPIKEANRGAFAVVKGQVMGELAGTQPEDELLVQLDSVVMPKTPVVPPVPIVSAPTATDAANVDSSR